MGLVTGTVSVRLALREAYSLKDKRRVVRSIKDTLRQQFNVSIAEVDEQDTHQLAVLGIAMAGSDTRYVEGALSKLIDKLRAHPVVELLDYAIHVETL